MFFFFFPPFLFFYFFLNFLYCSGFCHTMKWNSHGFTCVPHPDPSSHLPLHPIPLGLPSAPGLSAETRCSWFPKGQRMNLRKLMNPSEFMQTFAWVYFSGKRVLSSLWVFQTVYGHLRGEKAEQRVLEAVTFLGRRRRWRPCTWLWGVRGRERVRGWVRRTMRPVITSAAGWPSKCKPAPVV